MSYIITTLFNYYLVCEDRVLQHSHQSGFYLLDVWSRGLFREPASVHKCLRFSRLASYRLSLPVREMGSRSLRRPPHRSLFTLLSFYSSLTPSTLRTVRPSLPRLSIGGGRTRPGSRVALVDHSSPCIFRRSPWLPYTYSRASPSPVCLPQVAPELLFWTFLRGNTQILASTVGSPI